MSLPRPLSEEEARILVKATEGGAFDELLTAFYESDQNSKIERACERALDEECGRILGRRIRVWWAPPGWKDYYRHLHDVWTAGHRRVDEDDL